MPWPRSASSRTSCRSLRAGCGRLSGGAQGREVLPIRRAFFYPREDAMKLRTFLLAVVSLTLVPLLGVAGIAIWWAHQDERRNLEQVLLYHARSRSVAVDREVETTRAGLMGLSTSDDLDAKDLGKFYEQARLAREDDRRRWTAGPLG